MVNSQLFNLGEDVVDLRLKNGVEHYTVKTKRVCLCVDIWGEIRFLINFIATE